MASRGNISDRQCKELLEIVHKFMVKENLYPPNLDPKNERQVKHFLGNWYCRLGEDLIKQSGS